MKLQFTEQALKDLQEIRAYLSPQSMSGAEHVRLAIASTVDLLTQFPGIARDTDINDIRVISVVNYPYLIYHLRSKKEIVIIHIRHTSQNAPSLNDFRRQPLSH